MNNIYQVKITLKNVRPLVWRRVLVENTISFYELHHIIQIAMGWENCHAFEFEIGKQVLSDDDSVDVNSKSMRLSSFVSKEKTRFKYLYDFSDRWEHVVLVERILFREDMEYPFCSGGRRGCPPEDCGGSEGYKLMLDKYNNSNHPDHNYIVDWLGEDFNPLSFNVKEVNASLKGMIPYIRHWESYSNELH